MSETSRNSNSRAGRLLRCGQSVSRLRPPMPKAALRLAPILLLAAALVALGAFFAHDPRPAEAQAHPGVTVNALLADGTTNATFDSGSAQGAGVLPAELADFRAGGLAVSGAFPSAEVGAWDVSVTYSLQPQPGPLTPPDSEPQQQQQTADYDTDDDGLIEVSSLAQLDAIRWDLDGDGASNDSGYTAAFPNPATGMGCPSAGCVGYELTADLDFDTNGSGEADAGDQYWNDGQGWLPIGWLPTGQYAAVFEGNGHTIRNLYYRAEGHEPRGSGLFQALAETGVIRNVALKNVDLSGIPALKSSLGRSRIGGLVGHNWGTISNAGVTGSVSGNWVIGGLVAWNWSGGTITDSYSSGEVSANGSKVGGLVGRNWGGRIVRSWSTANVTAGVGEYDISPYWGSGGGWDVGGLVGKSWHELGAGGDIIQASIVGSYATGRVRGGDRGVGGLVGANFGDIFASYATGDVSGGGWSLGGLVGYSEGVISASYALGAVSGVAGVNGLVGVQHSHLVTVQRGDRRAGRNGHRCIDCSIPNAIPGHGDRSGITAAYWNSQAPGQTASRGVNMSVLRLYGGPRCTGRTTAELRQPTDYTGIYALWDDLRDYSGDTYAWDFGTSLDFPVLRDTGPSVAAQRALLPDVPDQLADPLDRNTRLIARMYQLRNDSYYKSYARLWDRVLLALGVTVADTTLTPMTAEEAQRYANTGWHDWRDVAYALSEPECPGQQQQQSAPPSQPPTVSSAIADVSGLEVGATQDVSLSGVFSDADGDNLTITAASSDEAIATASVASDGSALTLSGAAEGTATITVTAQDTDGDRVSDAFEAPVAKQYASLIAKMYQWRNDPCCVSDQAHTDRWDRTLLTFGETVSDTTLSPMTATEAQTYADRGWSRWVEVAAALRELENRSPTVSVPIGDATIVKESGTKTVSFTGVFSDADGDSLTITAVSDDQSIATAIVGFDHTSLTVTAQARGTATITVTADDGRGGTVSDTFTVTVKAAPAVTSSLSDVSGLEVAATQDVSLSGVFSDADGDSLTITAASSDEAKATVTVASDGSSLTVTGVSEGTATVTVTVQDADGNRVSDAFDVSVGGEYASLIAKMKEWRNDPCCVGDQAHTDRWDRTLLTFGETVADTTLTPMTADEAQGYADRGWTRWVEVVTALRELENRAPTVSNAIADATIVKESGTKTVSLPGVFSDADNDSLTITTKSSDEAVSTVAVASDYSTLTVTAKSRGTATVTATAADGKGGTVSDAFTVKVKAAPTVSSAISDVSGMEALAAQEISLSGVFSDADGDTLTLSASSSDDLVVEPVLVGDTLTVYSLGEGTATITVTAQDTDGNTVSDAFDVSVGADQQQQQQQDPPANQAPTVSAAIADLTIINESGTKRVSLSGVFSDGDGDSLTVTAASSDETKATVSVASDYSTLTVTAKVRGTATITVTAKDGNGGSVSDEFTVRVKAAPVVASSIGDVSGLAEGSSHDVSLSGVFSDADGDSLTITTSSSDDATATVTLASDQSKLTVAGVAEGTTTITVTARDADGNTVSDSFDVSVAEAGSEAEEDHGEPPAVTNLRCKANTNRVLFRWDVPKWSGGKIHGYDYQLNLPDGGSKSGRSAGVPLLY